MPANGTDPIFSIPLLRRDLYLLAALLEADARLTEKGHVASVVDEHYEGEAMHLLISIALFVRQMLDIEGPEYRVAGQTVGRHYEDYPDTGKEEAVPLRMACNKIIHARRIWLYNTGDRLATGAPARTTYDGTIVIRSYSRHDRKVRPHTYLSGDGYIQSCIMLCDEHRTGGD